MAIQPIDLSVMYSQMDNVAKFSASQNQAAYAANQSGMEKAAQEILEKSKAVQEAAKDNPQANTVRQDGRQGAGSDPQGSSKRRDSEEETENPSGQVEITDPRLGQHIDITG
ncbi:MAG: hypothetical protein J5930_05570 [Treponema sp.]|nr:hypothetical protein [Treponema sp.]